MPYASHPEPPLNYARVGATRVADHRDTPPSQHGISEQRARIGSGQARWNYAWKEIFSWGLQRRAGYTVVPLGDAPDVDTEQVSQGQSSAAFPPLRAGSAVQLRRRLGPLSVAMPIRVVYVIDEPHRRGFAFGTLAGHPVSGEVAFIVARCPDDSVWFTLRSLSGPGRGLWWFAYPVVLLLRGRFKESYLQSLAEPLDVPKTRGDGSCG